MKEIIELIKTGDNEKLSQIINDNPSLADNKTDQGISLLQFASYCRNKAAIDILREHRNRLDVFEAASIGDLGTVNALTDKIPEVAGTFSSDGFTPLGLAVFFGHLSIVKLLLEKGADPNIASRNDFKVAPIHSACAISHYEITRLLIEKGADVNARQMHGATPLHSAAHNGQTELARLLIDNGADVNAKMDNGQTPLFMALEKNFQETAVLIKSFRGE